MQHGRHLLRAWLDRSQLKQRELAARLGISDAYLSNILSGERRPKLELLNAIENTTGVSMKSWLDIRRDKTDQQQDSTTETDKFSGVQTEGAHS